MSMGPGFESELPSEKYWLTELTTTSVKSAYEVRFTLINQPDNEKEILDWLKSTFPRSGCKIINCDHGFYYWELFFKSKSDATMFVLTWGENFK